MHAVSSRVRNSKSCQMQTWSTKVSIIRGKATPLWTRPSSSKARQKWSPRCVMRSSRSCCSASQRWTARTWTPTCSTSLIWVPKEHRWMEASDPSSTIASHLHLATSCYRVYWLLIIKLRQNNCLTYYFWNIIKIGKITITNSNMIYIILI